MGMRGSLSAGAPRIFDLSQFTVRPGPWPRERALAADERTSAVAPALCHGA